MHVYCRRYRTERYCVEHEGMQTLQEQISNIHSDTVTPCEFKSLAFTSKCDTDHICVALSNATETTDSGFTYVLKIPYDDVDVVIRELGNANTTLHIHYIESMASNIMTTHVAPNKSWLVGANDRPCLPNSAVISSDAFRTLSIISYMRDQIPQTSD